MDALKSMNFHVEGFDSQAEHPFKPYTKPLFKFIQSIIKILIKKKVDLTKGSFMEDQLYREKMLEEKVSSFSPDILFIIRGNGYRKEFIEKLKQIYNIKKIVGWWVKDPRIGDEMIIDSKIYDKYFCIHNFGYTKQDKIERLPAISTYKKLYAKAKTRDNNTLKHDAIFIGGYSIRRHEFLSPIINSNINFKMYGPGWIKKQRILNPVLRKVHDGKGIWGKELVSLYHKSRIVVNVTSWDSSKMSGQNLRLFDVPCTGAFLITDYSDEVAEYFALGKEIETFKTPDELLDKIKFYLLHHDKREAIAAAGYSKAISLPTIADRMKSMLKIIGAR
ncbi:MAG: glycosyltransferase family 1 protein [Candidatus Brocadiales bacterium]|nr:glycosyltransferase family 1 protein [Candidatus Brocadiales bacterium]